jgi:predicted amidohydrolase
MAAPARVRVATAQYPVGEPGSFEAWRAKAEAWVGEGAATGASLLVFPEYGAIEIAASRGPGVASDLQRTLGAVADAMPEMDAVWARLSRCHGVHILAPSGPCRRADGRFVNAARLVTPDGRIGRQDKLIITPFEADWGIVPGERLTVFDTALGRVGIAICYDCEFPLLVRALAEARAGVILVPSCTERESGFHRIRAAALARALESTVAVVVSPTVGDAPWSPAVDRNTGAAGVFVPAEHALSMTGVLAEGRLNAPGWVAADIDLAALEHLRSGGEMRNRSDWALQPGAAPLGRHVEVVALV